MSKNSTSPLEVLEDEYNAVLKEYETISKQQDELYDKLFEKIERLKRLMELINGYSNSV